MADIKQGRWTAEIEGDFLVGDAIDITCGDRLVGRGIADRSAAELRSLLAEPDAARGAGTVVHRDQLVLIDELRPDPATRMAGPG